MFYKQPSLKLDVGLRLKEIHFFKVIKNFFEERTQNIHRIYEYTKEFQPKI